MEADHSPDTGRMLRNSSCPLLIIAGERGWLRAEWVAELTDQLKAGNPERDVTLKIFERAETGAAQGQCSEASCHSSGWKSRQQRSPDTVVVISSDGEGDRSVESLEVKAPVGWETGQIRTGGPAT
jgi:predicted CxxxxCH...CXXCH cytochrome family protein